MNYGPKFLSAIVWVLLLAAVANAQGRRGGDDDDDDDDDRRSRGRDRFEGGGFDRGGFGGRGGFDRGGMGEGGFGGRGGFDRGGMGEGGFGGRGGFDRGGFDRGGFGGRGGVDRGGFGGGGPTEFIRRMDINQNGLIDPTEVNPRFRSFLERAARDGNLDLNQPVPIAKLEEAMTQGRERMMRERMGDSGSPTSNGSSSRSDGKSSDTKSAPKATSLVPGFGTAADLKPVPGFGEPIAAVTGSVPAQSSPPATEERRDRREDRGRDRNRDEERSDSSPSASGAPSTASNTTGSSDTSSDSEDKVRKYAKMLLDRYDANKNGKLEREEWSKMASSLNAGKGDKDGDGNITLEEFSAHFAEQNSRGGSSSAGSSSSGGGSGGGRSGGRFGSSRPSSNSSSGRPTRFLTPTERLPEGLPPWWARNDRNADGQISMAEYSTSWTESQLREFNRYDANGDGLITPAECMASERK